MTSCQFRRNSDSVPSKSKMAARFGPRGKSVERISMPELEAGSFFEVSRVKKSRELRRAESREPEDGLYDSRSDVHSQAESRRVESLESRVESQTGNPSGRWEVPEARQRALARVVATVQSVRNPPRPRFPSRFVLWLSTLRSFALFQHVASAKLVMSGLFCPPSVVPGSKFQVKRYAGDRTS